MGLFGAIHRRLVAAHSGAEDPVELSERDARRVVFRVAVHYLRGLWLTPRLASSGGRLLVARGASVTSPERLTVGRGVKLEELCEVQCLSEDGVVLGDGVTVGRCASIRPSSYYGGPLGEGFEAGAGTAIGAFCWIGASGRVVLGRNVLMGPRVVLLPENHVFDDVDRPIKDQGVVREGVVVEDDCWLGSGVTVLAGVRIGRGSVVAAGAVVTRDVPPESIVAGVPARVLRSRRPMEVEAAA